MAPSPPLPTPVRPPRGLLLLVAACAAFGLLVLANNYALRVGMGGAFTWRETVLSLSRGAEWLVLAPTTVWLVRRFPPRAHRWPVLVPVYLAFAVVLHTLTEIAHTTLAFALDPEGTYAVTFVAFYWSSWKNAALFHLITFVAVAGAVYGYDRQVEALRYREAYRAREVRAARLESELAQAQLHALRMQLNPHFLFNTLSAASVLTTRDPRRARRVIVALGELLRLSLDTTDEEVPLHEEFVFLDHYLRIEEARMGDRLRIAVHADDCTLDALVPPLVLQPLVENAVKHGVAALEAGGAVEIEAARDGTALVLHVRDTGPGLLEGATPTEGIGLGNVRRRLEGLYGAAASLSLENPPGGGLTATVRFPFRTSQPTPSS